MLCLDAFDLFDTLPCGPGGVGKIKIKDHLSPAEAEIKAELGNCAIDVQMLVIKY